MNNVGAEVIKMFAPDAEFTIYGDDYDSIIWHKGTPEVSEKDYLAGFATLEQHKANLAKEKAEKKSALLEKLGITEQDAEILLG